MTTCFPLSLSAPGRGITRCAGRGRGSWPGGGAGPLLGCCHPFWACSEQSNNGRAGWLFAKDILWTSFLTLADGHVLLERQSQDGGGVPGLADDLNPFPPPLERRELGTKGDKSWAWHRPTAAACLRRTEPKRTAALLLPCNGKENGSSSGSGLTFLCLESPVLLRDQNSSGPRGAGGFHFPRWLAIIQTPPLFVL